jgi:hypothetical protein
MQRGLLCFNSILATSLALAVGCMVPDDPKRVSAPKPKPPRTKEATEVRIYLESPTVEPGRTTSVSVYRDSPITVNLDQSPVFTPAHIAGAEVLATTEGPALKIQLNQQGAILLDTMSVANRGSRIIIGAKWTEGRILGAPRLVRRISDGAIVFMPDATLEEMERIVRGVNNIASKNR